MPKLVIVKGRWISAWKGGPKSYRAIPRLAVSITGRFWRIDAFGRVFSSATIQRWRDRKDPLYAARRRR